MFAFSFFHWPLLGFLASVSRTNALPFENSGQSSTEKQNLDIRPKTLANRALRLSAPSHASNIYWPLEAPAPITIPITTNASNASRLTIPPISCNAGYGRNLNYASCLQVYGLMSNEPSPKTFGQRGTGSFDAPLPFRYLSRDGTCAIEVGHVSGIEFDTILPFELREAALSIIQLCVPGRDSMGGLYTGLGVNGGLVIRVAHYRPRVTCGPPGSGPPWISCRFLLDDLETTDDKQVFGPEEFENTTIAIPWSYTRPERRCALDIEPEGVSDTGSWYKIWEAGYAVDYMCTQCGRGGIAVGIGRWSPR